MIFFGDYAFPFSGPAPTITSEDKLELTFLNLEGALIEYGTGVFNHPSSLEFFDKLDCCNVNLANNHIFDNGLAGYNQTLEILTSHNINYVGTNIKPSLNIKNNSHNFGLVSAGWSVIGCKDTGNIHVNQLNEEKLVNSINDLKNQACDLVIVYLHWNYELEVYPHPAQRMLARTLIDNGADLIIGCHSHCMQGFEVYNDKYIFYGLGNFYMEPNYYYDKRLYFPDFTKEGLAIKIDNSDLKITAAITKQIDKGVSINSFISPKEIKHLTNLSEAFSLSDADYLSWFAKNRRKKLLLPIFTGKESKLSMFMKVNWIKLRGLIITTLLKLNLKSSPS